MKIPRNWGKFCLIHFRTERRSWIHLHRKTEGSGVEHCSAGYVTWASFITEPARRNACIYKMYKLTNSFQLRTTVSNIATFPINIRPRSFAWTSWRLCSLWARHLTTLRLYSVESRCMGGWINPCVWRNDGMTVTRENENTKTKSCRSDNLPTTNPARASLGSNPGLWDDRPATNRLSHRAFTKLPKLTTGFVTYVPPSVRLRNVQKTKTITHVNVTLYVILIQFPYIL
jgi:hypothetical protein